MAQHKTPCSSDMHETECEHEHMAMTDCCEDHTLVLEGSEELSLLKTVSVPDFHTTALLFALVSQIFSLPSSDYQSFNDYTPPLIERDIPVLVQSFLI
ncbi:hypothetical protein SAMN04488057_104164 [Cyclobacterium lianum]|uniref:Uncharacterized protein n=2 Tax=Cyclobacterium lianum TaxID=388280 RepID=A0A1M7M8N3_9BACT|nr:hypothetical protein SAMN04488057_104164 [Cyclobacterium lianum]